MFCINCGAKNRENANYCSKCGKSLQLLSSNEKDKREIINNDSVDISFRERVIRLFDFEAKKSFWEALILYGFVDLFVISIHIFISYDQDNITYVINGISCFAVIFMFSYLKRLGNQSIILSLIAGVIGYALGGYLGMLILFYIFMKQPPKELGGITTEEKGVIYSLLKRGLIWYLIGFALTIGSYYLSSASGESSYTIFYGMSIYGIYLFGKAVYYRMNPSKLREVANNLQDKNIKKRPLISAGFVKTMLILLAIGIVFIVIMALSQ